MMRSGTGVNLTSTESESDFTLIPQSLAGIKEAL